MFSNQCNHVMLILIHLKGLKIIVIMFNPKIFEWLLRIKYVPIMAGLNDYTQWRTQGHKGYEIAYILDKNPFQMLFSFFIEGKERDRERKNLQNVPDGL